MDDSALTLFSCGPVGGIHKGEFLHMSIDCPSGEQDRQKQPRLNLSTAQA